jgi:hypothetical protein
MGDTTRDIGPGDKIRMGASGICGGGVGVKVGRGVGVGEGVGVSGSGVNVAVGGEAATSVSRATAAAVIATTVGRYASGIGVGCETKGSAQPPRISINKKSETPRKRNLRMGHIIPRKKQGVP